MSKVKARSNLVQQSLDMSSIEIIRSRRACTVPQQLLRSYELPALPTHSVPRRYEETKPVKVQEFTHQRIIDLGELINRQSKEESESLQQAAVEKAVAETWESAHQIKMDAVKDAIHKSQVQHEKNLRKLARQHERAIKEEALAVETMMHNKMREKLEAERIVASQKLLDTVQEVKEQCARELSVAVAAAREEEQRAAALQREQDRREFEATIQAAERMLLNEKADELKELKEKLEKEQVEAVKKAHSEDQVILESTISQLKSHHLKQIDVIKQDIFSLGKEIAARDKVIEAVQSKRELLYDQLVQAQADFQHFIDKHPLFDPGQTNYLLPNVIANPKIINPYLEKEQKKPSNVG